MMKITFLQLSPVAFPKEGHDIISHPAYSFDGVIWSVFHWEVGLCSLPLNLSEVVM